MYAFIRKYAFKIGNRIYLAMSHVINKEMRHRAFIYMHTSQKQTVIKYYIKTEIVLQYERM